MSNELVFYLRRCAHPSRAAGAAVHFAGRAYASFLRRMGRSRRHEPSAVARARADFLAHAPAVYLPLPAEEAIPQRTLTLTTRTFPLREPLDWLSAFDDEEVALSLHRWNWLLRGLTDDEPRMTRSDGLELMRSWLRTCAPDAVFPTDAYTTGERIVNGSLFLMMTGDGSIPRDIATAFSAMAKRVATHLEYHAGAESGNHAFNNARALLFAGVVGNDESAVRLALEIARERLPRVATSDGFLGENSSHYHFLFTRWVLEMLWLCRRAHLREFAQLLSPYAAKLVERCWFFLVHRRDGDWAIPLVGDVSPDFPPEWLISLPWSTLARGEFHPEVSAPRPTARGWADLFGIPGVDGLRSAAPTFRGSELATSAVFPESGWYRVARGAWTLYMHAESTKGEVRASHRHLDLGGFALYYDGLPLLVDPGRLDYTASPLGRYGYSAAAHNTVLVDGLGPIADGPAWFADWYRAVDVRVEVSTTGEWTTLELEHSGFSRLGMNPGGYRRQIEMSRNRVVVRDIFSGTGDHTIESRFHFAPGLGQQSSPGSIIGELDRGLTFLPDAQLAAVRQIGQDEPPMGGLFFPAYGKRLDSTTISLSTRATLPVTFEHAVEVRKT